MLVSLCLLALLGLSSHVTIVLPDGWEATGFERWSAFRGAAPSR